MFEIFTLKFLLLTFFINYMNVKCHVIQYYQEEVVPQKLEFSTYKSGEDQGDCDDSFEPVYEPSSLGPTNNYLPTPSTYSSTTSTPNPVHIYTLPVEPYSTSHSWTPYNLSPLSPNSYQSPFSSDLYSTSESYSNEPFSEPELRLSESEDGYPSSRSFLPCYTPPEFQTYQQHPSDSYSTSSNLISDQPISSSSSSSSIYQPYNSPIFQLCSTSLPLLESYQLSSSTPSLVSPFLQCPAIYILPLPLALLSTTQSVSELYSSFSPSCLSLPQLISQSQSSSLSLSSPLPTQPSALKYLPAQQIISPLQSLSSSLSLPPPTQPSTPKYLSAQQTLSPPQSLSSSLSLPSAIQSPTSKYSSAQQTVSPKLVPDDSKKISLYDYLVPKLKNYSFRNNQTQYLKHKIIPLYRKNIQ